ncbi:MAG: hypothetical protein GY847_20120 [Proteobacteria bacterium]|nr:hypothetical protein [Pseudomonadota bacterium]
MLALRFNDPTTFAERANLCAGDAEFCKEIGKGSGDNAALFADDRLWALIRFVGVLKLLMAGILVRNANCPAQSCWRDPTFFQEYVLILLYGKWEVIGQIGARHHASFRVRLSRRYGVAIFIRRPKKIDLRYVVLTVLQMRVFQPLLHNRAMHFCQGSLCKNEPAHPGEIRCVPDRTFVKPLAPQKLILVIADKENHDGFAQYAHIVKPVLDRFDIQYCICAPHMLPDATLELAKYALVIIAHDGLLSRMKISVLAAARAVLNLDTGFASTTGASADTLTRQSFSESVTSRCKIGNLTLDWHDPIMFWLDRSNAESIPLLSRLEGSNTSHLLFQKLQACRSLEFGYLLKTVISRTAMGAAPVGKVENHVFVKLDDVSLQGSVGHILAIADTGLFVNTGLFLFDIPVDSITSDLLRHQRVSLSIHSGGWKHSYWANLYTKDKLTERELIIASDEQRAFFERINNVPSPVANLHFYKLQREAVPHLLSAGQIASVMYAGKVDNGYLEPHLGRNAASYAFGQTRDGLLLISGEDHNAARYSPLTTWDVLKRTTDAAGCGIVSSGSDRIYRAARHAFLAGMPAILSTHEFRMTRFRPEQIGEIFNTALTRLRAEGFNPVLSSDIETIGAMRRRFGILETQQAISVHTVSNSTQSGHLESIGL